MGGNLSNSFLNIVLTDNVNNRYSAGDRVDGVVYFNSKDDCQCRTIQLNIVGSEYLMFKSRGKKIYRRPIVDITVDLARFEGQKVRKGQYEYPFSIDLPHGLPSSINRISNPQFDVDLQYAVEVSMERKAPTFTFKSAATLRDSRTIFIRRKPRPLNMVDPIFLPPSSRSLDAAGCFNRGHVTVAMSIANPLISTEDPAVNLTVASNFWYPNERATGAHLIEEGFKTVTISIDEIITATPTTGGTAVTRTNLQSNIVKIRPLSCARHGVLATRKAEQAAHNAFVRDQLQRAIVNPERYLETDGATQVVSFRMTPRTAAIIRDSSIGSLFTVAHELTLTRGTPSKAFPNFKLMQIKVPIFYQPPFSSAEAHDAAVHAGAVPSYESGNIVSRESTDLQRVPAEWNGVVAEVVRIDMGQVEAGGKATEEVVGTALGSDMTMGMSAGMAVTVAPLLAASVPNHGPAVMSVSAVPLDQADGQLHGALIVSSTMRIGGSVDVNSLSNEQMLEDLISRMSTSADDVATVLAFCGDAQRARSMVAITPAHFGRITFNIHNPIDVPNIVALLAEQMSGIPGGFTCAHLELAVRGAQASSRVSTVGRCGNLCTDFPSQFERVEQHLSEFDRTIARAALFPEEEAAREERANSQAQPSGSGVPSMPSAPTHRPAMPQRVRVDQAGHNSEREAGNNEPPLYDLS